MNLAAKVTPAPGINTQVVNELKDAVNVAREKTNTFFQNFPVFATRLAIAGVNLLKLESRPLPGREFEFRFFFDMSASVADPDMVRLLGELEAHCEHFTFLGCYDEN